MPARPGEIFADDAFYVDTDTGQLRRKYFLILSIARHDDLIFRLLTSQAIGRPEQPRCHHGAPYPSFFIGTLGAPLGLKTWLDLRRQGLLDCDDFSARVQRGIIYKVLDLPKPLLLEALDCTASAPDTSREQEESIRDTLATLR